MDNFEYFIEENIDFDIKISQVGRKMKNRLSTRWVENLQ